MHSFRKHVFAKARLHRIVAITYSSAGRPEYQTFKLQVRRRRGFLVVCCASCRGVARELWRSEAYIPPPESWTSIIVSLGLFQSKKSPICKNLTRISSPAVKPTADGLLRERVCGSICHPMFLFFSRFSFLHRQCNFKRTLHAFFFRSSQ